MKSWTMLERLNDAGKTIIMVTHEDDIAEHAKRIIRMRDGLIIEDGPSPRMLKAQEAALGADRGSSRRARADPADPRSNQPEPIRHRHDEESLPWDASGGA